MLQFFNSNIIRNPLSRADGLRIWFRKVLWIVSSAGALALASVFSQCTDPGTKMMAEPLKSPVVLELFTSQGCSSCPPADRLLLQLHNEGYVHGREVIVLSHHVDYWNRLGWKDPYSSAEASQRQEYYARALSKRGLYTPQMVIDGRYETVGHNESEIRNAIQASQVDSSDSIGELAIFLARNATGTLLVSASSSRELTSDERLFLVLVQDGLSNPVPRGENANRTLTHDGVVLGFWAMEPSQTPGRYSRILDTDSRDGEYRIVVLHQKNSGEIIDASQIDYNPRKLC